jgi:hypothetical protein
MRPNPWHLARLRSIVVVASATTFVASLTQIAFVVETSDRQVEQYTFYGPELLIFGWASVLEGANLLVWPLVVAAWVLACCKRPVAAVIAASVAGALLVTGALTPECREGFATDVAWLANPIIAVTWVLQLRDVRFAALISAVTALGLTLCFLWVKCILGPGEEGMNVADFLMRQIISHGNGYWLWVASAAVLAAGVTAGNIAFRHHE